MTPGRGPAGPINGVVPRPAAPSASPRPSPPGAAGATTDSTAAADLITAASACLLANGAESERVVQRADQLALAAGGRVELSLGWTESRCSYTGLDGSVVERRFVASPTGVGMNRVMAVDAAIEDRAAGRLSTPAAATAIQDAGRQPPSSTLLFALACAVGACGLAVIFGADDWAALGLIALAAGLGGVVRRLLGSWGANNFWQVGVAGLLAGLFGAIAVGADVSSPLRLAAVCPCMVLVPGPHLLNGSLDIANLRLPLGLARLTFATVTLLSITAGLLLGLSLGGADLVLDPAGRDVPLWLDASAAAVVAVCYGIFYSAPLRILAWPFVVGAGVHALRWVALYEWHLPAWAGAGLACLVAGFVLMPVAQRFQVPFSAIGFASVVSLMPGLLVFRVLAGLSVLPGAKGAEVAPLLQTIVNDANVAFLTIFAMALGFLVPAACYQAARQRGHRE